MSLDHLLVRLLTTTTTAAAADVTDLEAGEAGKGIGGAAFVAANVDVGDVVGDVCHGGGGGGGFLGGVRRFGGGDGAVDERFGHGKVGALVGGDVAGEAAAVGDHCSGEGVH